jgi:IS30 family transposase
VVRSRTWCRSASGPPRSRTEPCRVTGKVDLLSGSKNSYIVTLVERHTRYVMLAKVPSRDTQTVITALIKQAKKLPDELYKSLTWDRGKELTDHKRFTMATDIAVYFYDPQSPWQRGSNENTNRLLRQYFPRGTDLSVHSQARLNYVARELNERPRETLTKDFTVADILMAHVLSGIKDEGLIAPYPGIASYRDRCLIRPAWKRTIEAYCARVEAG